VNFHKFHALFSTTLSQLAEANKSFAQDVFRKCSRVSTKHREWLRLLLRFLERCHKDGDEFLIHIVRITGDESWVSFLNVETKEQSKQRMHTHSPHTRKLLNTVCQKAGDNCFLGQERNVNGGIHATRDHDNVTSVLHAKY
jgi:spore coat polysaccharide biosynthesis protein SpsF (cytidylyltransferase family)